MKAACVRATLALCLGTFVISGNAHATTDNTWFLWNVYKAHFMAADGRIVDWNSEGRTTSEGQAYALFFALVANDRASFDLVLKWSQDNLAKGNLQENLPSWLWKRTPTGDWGVADENSASDADLWMAYTLIQAGRLWQEPSYLSLGRAMAQHIANDEVVAIKGSGLLLLPGAKGFRSAGGVLFANPSYEPLQLLAGLAAVFPDGPWSNLIESEPYLVSANVGHGFAMDWVRFKPGRDFQLWQDLLLLAQASAVTTRFAYTFGPGCWTLMRRAAINCSTIFRG